MDDSEIGIGEKIRRKIFCRIHGRELYGLYSKEQFRPRKLLRFEVHLTDHCNLNCIGCFHFSSIAPVKYLDVEKFIRDCKCLSELSGGKCESIHLMGGEPLLHPSFEDICTISRKYFHGGEIKIVTNAILLQSRKDSFWSNLNSNRVGIIITRYPLNIDYNSIEQKAKKMNVCLSYWRESNDKKQYKIPICLEGKQNIRKSFYQCHRPNICIQLRDGKLFTCVTAAYIDIFCTYFNKNLKVSNKDYIDIYKAKSIEDIFKFLCKPIPFCRYCNNNSIVRDIDWGVSKKDISEWV